MFKKTSDGYYKEKETGSVGSEAMKLLSEWKSISEHGKETREYIWIAIGEDLPLGDACECGIHLSREDAKAFANWLDDVLSKKWGP